MKIIFLDIDGVLFAFWGYKFSPAACNNLNVLLEKEPEAMIVISSSWRHLGLDQVKKTLAANNIDSNRAIDITGNETGGRGVQIQAWLDRHPEVTNFVVIDDEISEMSNIMDHVVKTNSYSGLTSADVDLALDILNKKV